MSMKPNFGLAAAAAIFALSAGVTTSVHAEGAKAKAEVVHCFGENTCKGTSDCKSYTHDCKGQNDCKGQGFKDISAKACAKQGGSLTPKA